MKYLPLLGALLLSASPAVAQDVVVLECDLSSYGTVIDAETSDVVDSMKDEETKVFKIDVRNKTLDGWEDMPEPVEIRDGEVIYKDIKDTGTFNMTMQFNPPGEVLGTGDGYMVAEGKTYNLMLRMTGSCKRANQ